MKPCTSAFRINLKLLKEFLESRNMKYDIPYYYEEATNHIFKIDDGNLEIRIYMEIDYQTKKINYKITEFESYNFKYRFSIQFTKLKQVYSFLNMYKEKGIDATNDYFNKLTCLEMKMENIKKDF